MKRFILLGMILIFIGLISINVNAYAIVGPGCRDNGVCEQDEGSSCPDCLGASCGCSDIRNNVCGADGNTYKNECTAKCFAVNVTHSGTCYCGDNYCSPQEKLEVNGCVDCNTTCAKPEGSSCNSDIECCVDYRCINKTCVLSTYSTERGNTTTGTATSPTCPIGCICTGNTVSCPPQPQSNATTNVTQLLPRSNDTAVVTPSIPILETLGENKGIIKTSYASAEYVGRINVEETKLYMNTSAGKKQIIIMPEDAINISETPDKKVIKKVELKEKLQKPVYSVKGTKLGKLFFIIPISVDVETEVDAETGKIISVNKPWWSFLVG